MAADSRWRVLGIQAECTRQAGTVEPDDDLVIDDGDGNRQLTGSPQEFLTPFEILGDVHFAIPDALGRKKLFRQLAGASGRGGKYDH